MIVKITEQNQVIYEHFFAKITQAFEKDYNLGDQAIVHKNLKIKNLDEYYAHIVDIAKLDGRFLRLPLWDEENELGEEFFTINADTRKITIPAHFRTNGIAVQEDNLAEIVYFTVDRYFDRTDLYTKDIEIRWSLQPTNKALVGDSDSVKAVFIDDESLAKEGKLIFGWPITKRMTAHKGTLSFAICFYSQLSNVERLYSLNTVPASIAINGGLVLDNPSCTDFSDSIMDCLVNSTYTPDSMQPIPTPIWTYLTWETNDNPTSSHAGNQPAFGYATYNDSEYELVNLSEDGTVKLQAGASAHNVSTSVSYAWYANSIFADDGNEDGDIQAMLNALETNNLQVDTEYIEVDLSKDFDPNLNYFKFVVEDGNLQTAVQVDTISAEALFNEYKNAIKNEAELPTEKLYEQRSSLLASEPGLYTVRAQAMSSITQGEEGNETTLEAFSQQIHSTTCIIPPALNMQIDEIKLATQQTDPRAYEIVDQKIKNNYLYVPDNVDEVEIYIDTPKILGIETNNDANYRGQIAFILDSDENYELIRNAFGYKIDEKTGEQIFGSPVLYAVPQEIKNLRFVDSYKMVYKKYEANVIDNNKLYFALNEDGEYEQIDINDAIVLLESGQDLFVEDGLELAQFGRTNIRINNSNNFKVQGIVIHKLNKTYAISNIVNSKIISKNASNPELYTIHEDGTMEDNFKFTVQINNDIVQDIAYDESIEAYSKTCKAEDEVTVTFVYNALDSLEKIGEIKYNWYKLGNGNVKVELQNSQNPNIIISGNTITFKGPYDMTGSYYVEVVNVYNNTKNSDIIKQPLYLGEKN